MYNVLKHAHSGLRWVVLALIVWAIVHAFQKRSAKANFTEGDKRPALFALIATHIQFLIGIILYFISPLVNFNEGFMKNAITRFYSVEHITMMILAVALITVGYSRGKRKSDDLAKFNSIFWFYLIGLLIMLVSIPWPFRNLGGAWF